MFKKVLISYIDVLTIWKFNLTFWSILSNTISMKYYLFKIFLNMIYFCGFNFEAYFNFTMYVAKSERTKKNNKLSKVDCGITIINK